MIQGVQLSLLGSNLEPYAGGRFEPLLPNNEQQPKAIEIDSSHHWVEEKFIERQGKRYGPYLYKRWRENGRLKSRYLGKAWE